MWHGGAKYHLLHRHFFRISSTDPIWQHLFPTSRGLQPLCISLQGMTISVVLKMFSNDASVFRPLEMACDPARDFECCIDVFGHVGIVLYLLKQKTQFRRQVTSNITPFRRLTEAKNIEHKRWIGLWYTPLGKICLFLTPCIIISPCQFLQRTGLATRWFSIISLLSRQKSHLELSVWRNRFHYMCPSRLCFLFGQTLIYIF